MKCNYFYVVDKTEAGLIYQYVQKIILYFAKV